MAHRKNKNVTLTQKLNLRLPRLFSDNGRHDLINNFEFRALQYKQILFLYQSSHEGCKINAVEVGHHSSFPYGDI